jgi:hypothetical protein
MANSNIPLRGEPPRIIEENDDDVLFSLIPIADLGIAGIDAMMQQIPSDSPVQITKTVKDNVISYSIQGDGDYASEIIFINAKIYFKIKNGEDKEIYITKEGDTYKKVDSIPVSGGRRKRRSTKRAKRTKRRSHKNRK